MISITKVFRFDAAHAILHYPGKCAQIHGHSYELHVTVKARQRVEEAIDGLGIIIDFKEIKNLIQDGVLNTMDHKIILSSAFLRETSGRFSNDELLVFGFEPTAENLLLFLKNQIITLLPETVRLHSLKLWETHDSYAEWSA